MAGNKKLRVGLAGCGGISGAWLPTLAAQEDVDVVWLVDRDEKRAAEARERYKLTEAKTASGIDAALAQEKPDIVCDCTVPEAHVKVTLLALKKGCHVFGEKPLADTMARVADVEKLDLETVAGDGRLSHALVRRGLHMAGDALLFQL